MIRKTTQTAYDNKILAHHVKMIINGEFGVLKIDLSPLLSNLELSDLKWESY